MEPRCLDFFFRKIALEQKKDVYPVTLVDTYQQAEPSNRKILAARGRGLKMISWATIVQFVATAGLLLFF